MHPSNKPIGLCILLTGCASVNEFHPEQNRLSIEPSQVKLLYQTKPECDHQAVAHIETRWKNDKQAVYSSIQWEAARLGANYATIESIETSRFFSFKGKAMSYRCADELPKTPF